MKASASHLVCFCTEPTLIHADCEHLEHLDIGFRKHLDKILDLALLKALLAYYYAFQESLSLVGLAFALSNQR